MENEKMIFNLAEGVEKAEIIIRQVDSVNELPELAPIKMDISGTIGAPVEFLRRRLSEYGQVNQKRCHVYVSRENMVIELTINENDPYACGKIKGALETSPVFNKFGINAGKDWEPNELGQFLKMNRAFFADRAENMKLVTDLKNFQAKINVTMQRQKSESGDFNESYAGAVTSNVPGAFKLKMPLFKGRPSEEIEVEVYANINGRNVLLQLYSPGTCQALEDIRDAVIDEEIAIIRELAPDIAIIEK
jgi:hypothetical protein